MLLASSASRKLRSLKARYRSAAVYLANDRSRLHVSPGWAKPTSYVRAVSTHTRMCFRNLMHVLGQKINPSKSSLFFSKRCWCNINKEIKTILNVPNESLNDKYLGMPSDIATSKLWAFKYLKDRLWSKVKGWIEKTLSFTSKEVLIKSVAQAVPVCLMSCFKIPRGLC